MKKIACLMFLLLLFLPYTAFSEEKLRTITVNGNYSMTVNADYAKINTQLKVISQSGEESFQAVTEQINEISQELKDFGLTKDDLIVSSITQGAEYVWRKNSRKLSGYYSACSLRIKVDAIEKTHVIHTVLAEFPKLTINHTEYGRHDESELRTKALQEALKSAHTKAQKLAETMKTQIGRVIHINENGASAGPIPREAALYKARSASNIQDVSTIGTVTIQARVVAEFEML